MKLPAEFADLERWVPGWCAATQAERHETLHRHSIEELKQFYGAMLLRMDAVTAYLNRFPLDAMPADAQKLLDLALTFAETAHPVDLGWKTTDIDDSFPSVRLQFLPPSC